ncbi:hypothetical protein ACFQ44_05760 [Levilactobacillus lanxiensis]|uniref:Uncharacterized protein n=1 Tax=Levilactobacillus lanxiensis TaxID=2799568 RepID=A0ABW4D3L8_9LACO|nr:hypothetical protein [Levilactobacillus lanxiensis]
MFDQIGKDSDFMTYQEFIERLRVDLNDPDMTIYDGAAPQNEDEYQVMLGLLGGTLK